ncbi:hypothetical protein [Mucisphaera sp.]|uniref:hypothetical protein n=1 Tax=Mucisphaera sp. TaxID=2913024 RepID=UPI003D0F029B
MKSIRIICPNLKCRSVLAVPESARGKKVRCKACNMRVGVPAPPAPSETDGEKATAKA